MQSSILLMSFFQKLWFMLDQWDTYLFLRINTVWTNSFVDSIAPWWREANTWIPLYLFLLIFSLQNFKKKAIPWVLFIVITLVLTDQISSSFVKNWIARPRPCRDPFLMNQVRLLLNNCSGGYSFTSSHATNHFGFATFLLLTLKPVMKKWVWIFFVWAATVSYAQVYVGVHYPLDVLCGGLMGCGIGYVTGGIYNKNFGPLANFETESIRNDQ